MAEEKKVINKEQPNIFEKMLLWSTGGLLSLIKPSFYVMEKETWLNHSIEIREDHANPSLLNNETTILIRYYVSKMFGWEYNHYYLQTKPSDLIIEFYGDNHYRSIFDIHNKKKFGEPITENTLLIDHAMIDRLTQVIGMSNYSLLLRNCEHVAKYVAYGKWVSLQIYVKQNLFNVALTSSNDSMLPFINLTPKGLISNAQLGAYLNKETEYSIKYIKENLFFQPDVFSKIILLLGPTGAGKSNVINCIFKQYVCESKASATGVTAEIKFFYGIDEFGKYVCVIDTVGFCDRLIPDSDIKAMIESRTIDQNIPISHVLLVFGERIRSEENKIVQSYLNKFKMNKFLDNFSLILTKVPDDIEDKTSLINSFLSIDFLNPFASKQSVQIGSNITQIDRYAAINIKDIKRLNKQDEEEVTRYLQERQQLVNRLNIKNNFIPFKDSWCTIL
jgi:GTP-binding protein EngB required for normal cell division